MFASLIAEDDSIGVQPDPEIAATFSGAVLDARVVVRTVAQE
jgi:hypothetical protein